MRNTAIQWAHHTFNPWIGCTKVSAGCKNCYAETLMDKRIHLVQWGEKGTRVVKAEAGWREPLSWDRAAKAAGERHRVFCASLGDVFEDWQGPMLDHRGLDLWLDSGDRWTIGDCSTGRRLTIQDVRHRLFRLIHETPNLDWLLLTKRPENIADALAGYGESIDTYACEAFDKVWHRRVWLGTSVEDQATAAERILHLGRLSAAVRFLSLEPLLGPLEIWGTNDNNCDRCGGDGCDPKNWIPRHPMRMDPDPCRKCSPLGAVDWVIVGGESGPDARSCKVEWIRSVVRQCQDADVPVFVKQLGDCATTRLPDGEHWPNHASGTGPVQFHGDGFGNYFVHGLAKKGGDPAEWPEDLRVREVPEVLA